ncbi:MAG TPA: four helix bundle protein [Bacteroidales bacterium]|nr:four helix bundle protein [Bacteroidales bacterium]
MEKKRNEILDLSFEFALDVIRYCDLLEAKKKYVISGQLLRSGTSIGANIREAQNAESVADFIHKLKIAAKEVDETFYWLQLCEKSENYPNPENIPDKLQCIKKLLNTIIATMKRKSAK